MCEKPLVSVLMGIYNNRNYTELKRSVDSILSQTFQDFEIIICNDGSDEDTLSQLEKIKKLDDRIHIVGYEKNKGLPYALNYAFKFSQGEYIARMDPDDISYPARFEKELSFLRAHEEYALVGCIADIFDSEGIWGTYRVPEIPQNTDFLWNSPFLHPSIIIRRHVLEQVGGYKVTKGTVLGRSEDYELFMRLYKAGYCGYNIQEKLMAYQVKNGNKKYRKMKVRFWETVVRIQSFPRMQLGWRAFPYAFKPLIVGCIPQFLFRIIKKVQYGRNKPDGKKVEKIRVAHVAGGLTTGGVESVIYNYMSHIDRERYELTFITYDTPEPQVARKFQELGFQIFEVPKKKEHFFKSCIAVYGILRKRHIQIVHSHMTHMCFITNILGYFSGARILIAHSHLALRTTGIKGLCYNIFKWLSVVTATDYFACGEAASEYLFGKKLKHQVYLLHNAIDLDLYAQTEERRRSVKKQFGLSDKTVIGHVGRFTEQKNQGFLIEVLKKYAELNPDSCMMLIGDGPLKKETERAAEDNGIKDKVLFFGSRQDVQELLGAMDLFVLPSLYEGLPLVLIEAQAAGLGILASDTIDRHVNICGGIQFLGIDQPPEKWAGKIHKMILENAVSDAEKMKDSIYDIYKEACRLDTFYRERVSKRNE